MRARWRDLVGKRNEFNGKVVSKIKECKKKIRNEKVKEAK